MLFTTTNKALMQRAARNMTEQAAVLKNSYGQNWAASKEAKVAKRQYDRLLRDARDLRELADALYTGLPQALKVVPCAAGAVIETKDGDAETLAS